MRHEPLSDTSENSFATFTHLKNFNLGQWYSASSPCVVVSQVLVLKNLGFNLLRVIQSTAASSVITFHIHTYCSPLTMDTCTDHIYTTLYIALSDYIGDYISDYMITALL